jgi:hypothetical protein
MANLSNSSLRIDPLTGTTYRVTAKVTVQFTTREQSMINSGVARAALPIQLKSNLWGYDGNDRGREGSDDSLLLFPTQNITRSGTYTFSTTVSSRILNEDIGLRDQDEIYNAFTLVSRDPTFIPSRTLNSPIVRGFYGSTAV